MNNHNPPIHWWQPDGAQACDPDGGSGYIGAKLSADQVTVADVCPECFAKVTAAQAVVGTVE